MFFIVAVESKVRKRKRSGGWSLFVVVFELPLVL